LLTVAGKLPAVEVVDVAAGAERIIVASGCGNGAGAEATHEHGSARP
jgi:hypothetical protein